MKKFLFFLIIMITFSGLKAQDSLAYYCNPLEGLNIGDPSVVKFEGKYYLYGTSWERGYLVWESDDLVNWESKGIAFDRDWDGNQWGKTGTFWAPEVIQYFGQFYLVYSARDEDGRLKIAIATSNHPMGPFKNVAAPVFDIETTCLDGHLFVDDDDRVYLYYARNNFRNNRRVSEIHGVEISLDYLELYGEHKFCISPDQDWELYGPDSTLQEPFINEAPFVVKNNEIYYLMYSGRPFWEDEYSVGYATSNSPLGPWKKFEGNPVLTKNMDNGVTGPGHNCIISTFDEKETFVLYHSHQNTSDGYGGRSLNIDRMYFRSDSLFIDGPTRSPQPMPSSSTSIDDNIKLTIDDFRITGNYPNPFNSSTTIEFELSRRGFVSVAIYDIKGRLVKQLDSGYLQAGKHRIKWDGNSSNQNPTSSGVYFCKIRYNNKTSVLKMVLEK